VPLLHSFGHICKSGIAESYGRSMLRFLRSLQIFVQSGCTSLHSHQQCTRFPFFPHPHQHLLLVLFLMMAILTGVRCNLNVVLICISFMDRSSEHFFPVFFGYLKSSFEKVLFSSVAHFFTLSLTWEEFSFLSSLYIVVISPLSVILLANIFFHSVGGLAYLETISFVVQKLVSFMKPHLSILSLSC
jgi:hypothetical protein